eukprot:CAMPEP_0204901990 /NCGR_PEP_ID=MMETSP1397-20131031/3404_1 /ASSEMBLY_ACC=CAM_ASM_000891 /TAXON_ID=49980 /ORGANISM="Climacostomum Climacostomum virens, Strain Stock W-24" /LENGTH=605 /DNA_ID=CAMNT_0052070429 /DNA_START=798 /DNA_END=2612 /DNA_ORIENTATION=-
MAKVDQNEGSQSEPFTHGNDFPRIRLTWEHVELSIKNKTGRNTTSTLNILKDITGYAEPGELLVIMGTSGAGKSTLLSVLNGWVKPNKTREISGSIKANGVPINEIKFGKISGNVLQDDILLANMTVRECLQFSADLRTSFTSEEKEALVDKLLEDLRLKKVEHSRIGSAEVRGISGGEKKRVCIGIELIVNPSVLFLDEPTSGLDSFTALAIMKLIKEQAKLGRTVICTLHQPSSEIVELIDSLIVMTDGHIIYHNTPVKIRGWFEKLGFPFPEYGNPIDFLLHICTKDDERFETREQKNTMLLNAYHAKHKQIKIEEVDEDLRNINPKPVSTVNQFKYLLGRSTRETFRNKALLKSKLGLALFLGGIYNILYYNLDDSRKGIQNRNGLFFMLIITLLSSGVLQVVLTFPLQRAVFIKEQGFQMYGTLVYFWAKLIPEAVMEAVIPTLFFLFLYWIEDLNTNTVERPLIFWGICILAHFAGGSGGFLIGCIVSNVNAVSEFMTLIFFPDVMYSGFLANYDSIPIPFRYLTFLSSFRYAYSAMAQNEFTGLDFACEDARVDPCDPLEDLNTDVPMWLNLLVLAAITIVFRVMAGVFLKLLVRRTY